MVGTHGLDPQTWGTPLPPQNCGLVQLPQLSVLPQPSETVPQLAPCAAQLLGGAAGCEEAALDSALELAATRKADLRRAG